MEKRLDKELLIKELATRCNFTLTDTKTFFEALVGLFAECIESDVEIDVRGFGNLYTQDIPERNGYQPFSTGGGVAMRYPPAKRVIFRLAGNLRNIVKTGGRK